MRIAIFGIGGVGGYFGGRLAQAGEDVVFIARGEHLKAIKSYGQVIEQDPTIIRSYLLRGATYHVLARYEEALAVVTLDELKSRALDLA